VLRQRASSALRLLFRLTAHPHSSRQALFTLAIWLAALQSYVCCRLRPGVCMCVAAGVVGGGRQQSVSQPAGVAWCHSRCRCCCCAHSDGLLAQTVTRLLHKHSVFCLA
jgi:hypothetical protein